MLPSTLAMDRSSPHSESGFGGNPSFSDPGVLKEVHAYLEATINEVYNPKGMELAMLDKYTITAMDKFNDPSTLSDAERKWYQDTGFKFEYPRNLNQMRINAVLEVGKFVWVAANVALHEIQKVPECEREKKGLDYWAAEFAQLKRTCWFRNH